VRQCLRLTELQREVQDLRIELDGGGALERLLNGRTNDEKSVIRPDDGLLLAHQRQHLVGKRFVANRSIRHDRNGTQRRFQAGCRDWHDWTANCAKRSDVWRLGVRHGHDLRSLTVHGAMDGTVVRRREPSGYYRRLGIHNDEILQAHRLVRSIVRRDRDVPGGRISSAEVALVAYHQLAAHGSARDANDGVEQALIDMAGGGRHPPIIIYSRNVEAVYRTKAQVAAVALRGAIRRGELRPGERIDVEQLSARLQMSITPVREALRQLEAEGLVVNHPHREIRVAEFSTDAAEELYALRALLEGWATQLSVPRLTAEDVRELQHLHELQELAWERNEPMLAAEYNEKWHMKLYSAAGKSPYLREFVLRLWNAFPWTTTWQVPGRGNVSVADHAMIMERVCAKDGKGAGELLRRHILNGKQLVMKQLANPGQGENASDAAVTS
jgi:DNA-binding GntR family transcriptional regulator